MLFCASMIVGKKNHKISYLPAWKSRDDKTGGRGKRSKAVAEALMIRNTENNFDCPGSVGS